MCAERLVSSVARFDFQTDPPPTAGVSGSGGGNVEDVLRRLGSLEKDVSAIKTEVGAITAQLPHLATKADVASVKADVSAVTALIPLLATKADLALIRTDVSAVMAQLPQLATKADFCAVTALLPHLATKAEFISVRAEISDAKASIVQWIVSTIIAVAALAFAIARFVH